MRLSINAARRPAGHRQRSRQRDHAARQHHRRDRAHRRIRRAHLVVIVPLAVVGLLVTASSASAETTHVVALAASVDQVLTNIRSWIMGILAGLATVFVSVGGVRYVMAGGDPGEVEKAKTAFRAAGIGYGMAALAPLVVTVLRGIVGA
jgi:Type IV secretion system pilin